MTKKIELSKIRDFGEIITDSFIFARQNLKPLLSAFFVFCGFFLVAGAITASLQQIKVAHTVNSVFDSANAPSSFRSSTYNPFSFLGIEYLLSILFIWLNYVSMTVVVFSFIALYKEKGNVAPTLSEVWGYFKYFFFRIFGSSILLAILMGIAFALCIIPGIYLFPIMGLVYPIMVFENSSLGYGFNKSFRLIKDKWWLTAGSLFVMFLILYIATVIIVLPTTIINLSSMFLHPGKGMHLSAVLTIITTLLQHLCEVFVILPLITISLCYFNLNEVREGTGLMERISKLGNTKPDDNLAGEEY
jgi:hypothetical protein